VGVDVPAVAVVTHEACSLHDTGWHHPEHQGRLRAVVSALGRALPELAPQVDPIRGVSVDRDVLRLVHTVSHLDRVECAAEQARDEGTLVRLDPDTVVSGASWEAARAAAGCAVRAVDEVVAGRYTSAFCPVRPPGHHAEGDRAMGFCLLNNVAIAARYAVEKAGLDRVLIVDWDVHHGNGTQDIFYEDASVFYLSMHQSPFYPGTGMADERGAGAGEGTTLNLPLPPGLPAARYVDTLLGGIDEAAGFRPELVLISAGFDAAIEDTLGGFTLEEEHFRELTRELIRRTAGSARGRVVSTLEGGYNPEELGRNVVAHLGELVAARPATEPENQERAP
jgi:acetoin utilization deacetylase AcuC-like enzyme